MNTIIHVARENPAFTPWRVLIKSLEDQPKVDPVPYVHVTQAMRNHCARIRGERARQQREALVDAILGVLTDVPLSTQAVADACSRKSVNAVKRRLVAMAADGLVTRTASINKFGLKALSWTVAPC